MKVYLAGFNAAVVASVFNPSVIRESWLIKEGLLGSEELQTGYLFSDQAVHVPTARFALTVVPQQLQFAPTHAEGADALVREVLAPLVQRLPHTPFTAVGINFLWNINPDGEDIHTLTRRLFSSKDFPLAPEFNGADASFGLYMSKSVASCRLKLDIKPVLIQAPGKPKQDEVMFAFNYHRDLTDENAVTQIVEVLSRWAELDAMSRHMIKAVTGENLS